ncbi:MAG: CBS domain-containing protein [Candidatus Pelagibacter sp.]|nr:CBS domain-containing protein [Candidatus Pelagibacter sp.]OUV88679.1 MAG: CBS domain-containing protein [Pelagibacteraceae bacterium TMED136]|tara:strand:+ start:3060 stop:3458 length:399 start_codon:yes stop_codon:yes gene_type:complete
MIKNKDIMIKVGAFPIVKENTIFKEAIEKMSEFNLGILCIVDNKFELRGIITDGDLRRMLLNIQKPFSAFFVDDIIKHSKKNPITSFPDEDIKKTLIKMNLSKVWDIPIIENHKLVGLVHLHPAIKNLVSKI